MKDILKVENDVDFIVSYNGDYDGDCWSDLILLCRNNENKNDKLCFYRGDQQN